MKKLLFLLSFSVLLLNCGSDDPVPVDPTDDVSITDDDSSTDDETTGTAPSDFSLVTSDVYFTFIDLVWEAQTDAEALGITYSVYVDGTLVASALELPEYKIEELVFNTDYNLRIVAQNEFGSVELELVIATLDPEDYSTFLLKEETYNGSDTRLFEYTSDGRLININREDIQSYDFEYNSDGQLLQEDASIFTGDYTLNYYTNFEYADGQLTDVLNLTKYDFDVFAVYNFESLNTSPYTLVLTGYFGPTMEETTYEVIVSKDADGRIISRSATDLSTSEVNTTEFSYYEGNLSQVILNDGTIYDFEYDSNPSLRTYSLARDLFYLSYKYTAIPSLTRLPSELNDIFFKTPELYGFGNQNNVTRYLKNGVPIVQFDYEYSSFGYPDVAVYTNLETGGTTQQTFIYYPIE